MSASSENAPRTDAFRMSWLTFRAKLLLFVGALLVTALGGMILVATLLYRENIETQTQEYNLSLARLVGAKLTADLRNLELGAQSMVDQRLPGQATATRFFEVHPYVVLLGAARGSSAPSLTIRARNQRFLRDRRLPDSFGREALDSAGASLFAEPDRPRHLVQVQTDARLQLLALRFPGASGSQTIVVLLDAGTLLRTFRRGSGRDAFELYLIDRTGRPLARAGRASAPKSRSFAAEPLVGQMLSAQLDNGSRRYEHRGREYLGSYQLVPFAGLGVLSRLPAERAFEAVFRLQRRTVLVMIIVLAVTLWSLYFFARGVSVPIRRLVDATRQIEQGRYDVAIEPSSRDEIGLLTNSFASMSRGLEERERLQSEMAIARRIQTALLPEKRTLAGYSVAAAMRPAKEVGGDYYDLVETRHGEAWLAIGDVSGHGVESGLIQMMVQTSIHSLVESEAGRAPSDVLRHVNQVLRENIARLGVSRYITVTLLRLDDRRLTYAGRHEDLLVHRAAPRKVEAVETEGSWLGLSRAFGEHFDDRTVELMPGDTLLLYTDGVTEAANSDEELFGTERLQQVFGAVAHAPLAEIRDRILAEVEAFQEKQRDDFTLLLLRVDAAPESPPRSG